MSSKSVARLGDVDTGHDTSPPRSNVQGSENVFVNNLSIHRITDEWGPHDHTSTLGNGSSSVFANNLNVGRVGDPVACGGSVATGSPNVFAG